MTQAGWQPIDTAPKDVSVILLYRYRKGSLSWAIGYWHDDIGDWAIYNSPREYFTGATHWMPLPLPPEPPRQIEEAQRADTATAES